MSKIDFSKFKPVTITQKEIDEAGKKVSKFMEPGLQACKVTNVDIKGKDKRDGRWLGVVYSLENSAGQVIKTYVVVPTEGVTFKDDKYYRNFKKFQALCLALFDAKIDVSNASTEVPRLFADTDTHLGLHVNAVVGYEKAHHKYAGKNAEGKVIFHLCRANGEVVLNDKAEPLTFPDRESVELYCGEQSLAYSGFCNVLEIKPPASPNVVVTADPVVAEEDLVSLDD